LPSDSDSTARRAEGITFANTVNTQITTITGSFCNTISASIGGALQEVDVTTNAYSVNSLAITLQASEK
jgi:hypothetical protein